MKRGIGKFLLAAACAVGLTSAGARTQTAPQVDSASTGRAIDNGTTGRASRKTVALPFAAGLLDALTRGNQGVCPRVWEMSAPCRRMVRKSRMRRAGVGGARI